MTVMYLQTTEPELLIEAVEDIDEMNLPTFATVSYREKINDRETKICIQIDSPITAYQIGKRFAELKQQSLKQK